MADGEEEQRKASLLQALGIAGAGALSTKVAGKMGQSLATKGTEKLNNMRNMLRTSAVANVTKQAYQSVKNAPASWTQSLHKTYNNILDSSMPRLMPELVPAGPALAQQTVRETLQNVKQQTMQMVTKVKYYPNRNSYRGPGGRFMSESDVKKLGDEVEVETVHKQGRTIEIKDINPTENKRIASNQSNQLKKPRKPIKPDRKKWVEKGGSIKNNKDGTITFTNSFGQSVTYDRKGYPDFSPYAHPKVEPVKITVAYPENRKQDFKNANIKAGLNKETIRPVRKIDQSPEGYTWHHHEDGTTMILVEEEIHAQFSHSGGVSVVKQRHEFPEIQEKGEN
ncbi:MULTISPECIES: HNH endonuclease [Priestia]|uniref:HNH endonuclease n=1 Tax=Priestia TaxID=2800373 RepID=UPI000BF9335A|nr:MULTISPECIES: HNH endonuclease [Priestia]MBX9994767.1 HNH endonuclease [Priestia aryabhattai]MCM3152459.1 HNH endonuclease [Priestia megaterium]PFW44463.1 hypothetical protein COL17_25955 [Priestia megaterium]PGY48917.1 hypothetical protein COE35_26000 [Priestia megaterium]